MTVRDYCSCNSCNKKYIIRYGVSDQFPQKASFFCSKCGERLTYGFDKKKDLVIENLTKIDVDETADSINLHPELLVDKDASSNPYYFATLDFMAKQQRKGDEDFVTMRKMQRSVVAYNKGWEEIAKNLRLVNEERYDVVDKNFGRQPDDIRKKVVKKTLETSKAFLEGPWKHLYENAISELERARQINDFSNFRAFLLARITTYVDNLYNIMLDFEKVKTEMLLTLAAQKCGHTISGRSSTVDWEKLEKVYGDLYERYGDLVLILTGINNLNSRGTFDQFNTADFTIQKYLDSDKANRCKNFETNPKFSEFANFFDASIRNGTHHKNAKIDKENQEIVLGVGKGGNTEKRVSFVEYISYCNELHARCLIMLNLIFKVIYS